MCIRDRQYTVIKLSARVTLTAQKWKKHWNVADYHWHVDRMAIQQVKVITKNAKHSWNAAQNMCPDIMPTSNWLISNAVEAQSKEICRQFGAMNAWHPSGLVPGVKLVRGSPSRHYFHMMYKRLCYCRGTARRATSVQILWPFFDWAIDKKLC